MKYLLLRLGEEKYWFELGNDNYVNRQIILDENKGLHISCLENCLAEGEINEEDLEGDIIILTQQEFEDVWQYVLKRYQEQWKQTKKKYPINSYVEGVNDYLYPQGTIVRGKDFIAIYSGNVPFCINKLVQYRIKTYDDKNMWLVVE